jgi:hypothetical protein
MYISRNKRVRLAILCCITALIFLFGLNGALVERFYTNRLYEFISVAQRLVSSWFPFATGDLLYLLFIGFCCWSVVRGLKKIINRNTRKAASVELPLQLLNFVLLLYIVFKILWGLNYSRPSISGQLGIDNKKYTTKDLVLLGEFLIERLNAVQVELDRQKTRRSFPIGDLRAKAAQSYHDLATVNGFFTYRAPSVKPVTFDWGVTKIGLEGYYNPLSGEANINMRLPAAVLPFVTAHEISHQLGVAREDEANLVGYLVSINSTDLNFQYSGYYNILRNVLFEIKFKAPDDFDLLYKKINKTTLLDFQTERNFWMKYNNNMFDYMNVALDSFLKINNQQKGVDSYQDIVLWVFNLHRKELETGRVK